MKKLVKTMAVMTVLTMVLAACSQGIVDEPTPAAQGETMEKEMSEEEAMAKEDDMKSDDMSEDVDMNEGHSGDDMKDDDMDKEDDMDKDDDMKKDNMSMMNEGPAAPDFSLMNLNGETVALSDFDGEKVYVKYWASWCSICVAGLPEIDQLAGMNEDFQVVTIVTPDYLGEKSIEEFKEWFGMKDTENLTVLLDVDGVYAKEFGVRAVPTSAYIGSDGVLIKVAPGHSSNEQIAETFEKIN